MAYLTTFTDNNIQGTPFSINKYFILVPTMNVVFLGFLSYRGFKGLDYDEILFEAKDLPDNNITWFIKFNDEIYEVKGNIFEIYEREGTYLICLSKQLTI